tara:strand:- start:6 stop:497 length:492 start_codon:yes stop_codon:yes gene_type:complete
MPPTNISQLTKRVAKKSGVRPDKVGIVIRAFLGEILDDITAGKEVHLRNFGWFAFSIHKAHHKAVFKGFNEKGGIRGTHWCPEKIFLKFKAGKFFKEALKAVNIEKYKEKAHITKERKRLGYKFVPGKQATNTDLRKWWGELSEAEKLKNGFNPSGGGKLNSD